MNFTAIETQIGSVMISAVPEDPAWFANAKLVTWYGYLPVAASGPPHGAPHLPGFSLDTAILGEQYFTREFPKPSVNVSFSQPGIHYCGIYGAWNGPYGEGAGTSYKAY